MSAHNNGSGPRSNSYSANRFTNWTEYAPWWLEIQSVFKRFDGKIAKRPAFPKIIAFEPIEGFIRSCSKKEVEAQLMNCPPHVLKGLRAIFILPGTKKQLKSWKPGYAFYGHYWQSCIFLHAYPFKRSELVSLRRFFIRDVLMHEIGHHLDMLNFTQKDRENFAEKFARENG